MIKANLQFFGGRGASGGIGNSGKYRNAAEFEKAMGNNYDSPEVNEYSEAYQEEDNYTRGLKNNIGRSISEDGYTGFTEATLDSEERQAKKELSNLNRARKTPEELGRIEALKERIEVISELRKRKGTKGSGRGNVDIV